jgi:hypothetical protein
MSSQQFNVRNTITFIVNKSQKYSKILKKTKKKYREYGTKENEKFVGIALVFENN